MFGNNTENWLVILKNRNKNWKTLANFWKIFWYFLYFFIFKCSKRKLSIFEVLGKFWRGLEEPRSDKIYSSGNRGVKKGPGPRGSRDEEFLVPSLMYCILKSELNKRWSNKTFHSHLPWFFCTFFFQIFVPGDILIPPPPGWTSVDFLLTPPPPLLVHVVVEWPLSEKWFNMSIICILV